MSSMQHESDLVLREDSLTRVTTGLVELRFLQRWFLRPFD